MVCAQVFHQPMTDRITVAMPLNSSGMYRGLIKKDGVALTAIFDDDSLE
jgi:beta-aspartyl-peptidase (threonine type)